MVAIPPPKTGADRESQVDREAREGTHHTDREQRDSEVERESARERARGRAREREVGRPSPKTAADPCERERETERESGGSTGKRWKSHRKSQQDTSSLARETDRPCSANLRL